MALCINNKPLLLLLLFPRASFQQA